MDHLALTETILQSTLQLPPFPAVIRKALQLVDDPKTSAQDVVDVIQYDQSLTADVLRLCNSAYMGLRRKVSSLKEALVLVGFNPLLEIIVSRESARLFHLPCKGYELEKGHLWQHSVASALLSQILFERLNRPASAAHFTAALLHDMGKLILSHFVEDYFEGIKRLTREEGLSFPQAEREVLGVDHAELGGRITEQWSFPKSIVSAVRFHHSPSRATEGREMAEIVYLCDLVALITGIGGGADGLSYHADPEVMKRYGLGVRDVERFIAQLEDRFSRVETVLSLQPLSPPASTKEERPRKGVD